MRLPRPLSRLAAAALLGLLTARLPAADAPAPEQTLPTCPGDAAEIQQQPKLLRTAQPERGSN